MSDYEFRYNMVDGKKVKQYREVGKDEWLDVVRFKFVKGLPVNYTCDRTTDMFEGVNYSQAFIDEDKNV